MSILALLAQSTATTRTSDTSLLVSMALIFAGVLTALRVRSRRAAADEAKAMWEALDA